MEFALIIIAVTMLIGIFPTGLFIHYELRELNKNLSFLAKVQANNIRK